MRSLAPTLTLAALLLSVIALGGAAGLAPLPLAVDDADTGGLKPHRLTDPDPRVLEALEQIGDYGFAIGPGLNQDPANGFESCGEDIALVFRNADLMPRDDGYVYATGRFFIQFQAIGDKAMEIEEFAFSFGKPIPDAAHTCDTPEWITGGYIKDYRMDRDPRNGFFVPVNTTLVPDGEYAAAVHAYDGNGNELTRYWVNAYVENGCELTCGASKDLGRVSEEDIVANDYIMPWPKVLPGDGDQVYPVGGLTIEFGEELQRLENGEYDVRAWQNGARVPLKLWEEAPLYNDDPLPDRVIDATGVELVERRWGPAFHWNGVIRENDVIRVRAADLNGNQVEKILHIGDPTIGGRIPLEYPELEVIGGGQRITAENGTADFPFEFRNVGQGSLHGDIIMDEIPEGMRAGFDADHIMIGANAVHFANLTITATPELDPGSYDVSGTVAYQRGSVMQKESFEVTFVLDERVSEAEEEEFVQGSRHERQTPEEEGEETETQNEGDSESRGLPAPGALLGLAALAAAGVLGRRRD